MYLRPKGPRWAAGLTEKLTDFFFPWGTYCVCCGNFIDGKRSYLLCDHCIRKITWGNVVIPPESLKNNNFTGPEAERLQEAGGIPVDSIRACMKYGLYERRLIFELKYNGHTYMARVLARILADRLISDSDPETRRMLQSTDYIIPVPMHRSKERTRGFNQTVKVAGYLGDFLGIPVLAKGLVRAESTAAQRSIEGRDRLANLEGAFLPGGFPGKISLRGKIHLCRRIPLAEAVCGKNVILLDDIFTTGATVIQCGRVLKEAGADRVDVLTVATGNDFAEGFFEETSGLKC